MVKAKSKMVKEFEDGEGKSEGGKAEIEGDEAEIEGGDRIRGL